MNVVEKVRLQTFGIVIIALLIGWGMAGPASAGIGDGVGLLDSLTRADELNQRRDEAQARAQLLRQQAEVLRLQTEAIRLQTEAIRRGQTLPDGGLQTMCTPHTITLEDRLISCTSCQIAGQLITNCF